MPPHGPPTERLAAFIRGHLQVVENEIETAAVFFHEWTHLSEESRRHVIERRDAYQAHLKEIIAAGVAAGVFRASDVGVATLLTLSTLNWSYQWVDPAGRMPLNEIAEQYVTYVLGALGGNQLASPLAAAGVQHA